MKSVSRQKPRIEAAKVLPRLDVLMPCLTLDVMASDCLFCLVRLEASEVTLRHHYS